MTRLSTLGAAVACLTAVAAHAADPSPATKAAASTKVAKAAPVARTAAKAAPAEAAAARPLSEGQLAAAAQVYTGEATCEFDERIRVQAIDGMPGHFRLEHRKASYTLTPQETTTGAVRLEDARHGIVWLQIPAKSMLMNSKRGQRMADQCLHEPQRAAAAAPPVAATAIGIAVGKP